MTRFIEL